MKKLLAVAVLGLVSVSANAAGSYTLSVVNAYNPFSGAGTAVVSGTIPTASTLATVDGSGIVSIAGVQFSFANANATFNYTGGSWSGAVGGTAVVHTETCVEAAGNTSCSSPTSGLAGLWTTGLQNGGLPSNACSPNAFFGAGACDRVSITEVAGVSLTIVEQSEFAIAGLASGYIYRFVTPVPAAVWLFGSALGLLGLRRRVA
jgi:hypothetical protein